MTNYKGLLRTDDIYYGAEKWMTISLIRISNGRKAALARLKNFHYAMSLSKERLRIAEASHLVGKFSGLDYQQAKVDFNADSAQYIKQQELLHSSRIQLNELMANNNVNQNIIIKDSTIDVYSDLQFDDLWNSTLATNASLLKADQNTVLAQLDYKKINSRNYPYLKLNTGYGYTFNKYDINANSRRGELGFNAGNCRV